MMSQSAPVVKCEAWVVKVPPLEQWVCSPEFGDHPSGSRLLLRIEDADGREGWGEGKVSMDLQKLSGPFSKLLHRPPESHRISFLDLWEPGQHYWQRPLPPSPYTPPLEKLRHRLRHPLQSLVEMALLDLTGRKLDCPVSHFFGGRWRDRVKSDYWVGRSTPELAARAARRGYDLGFRGIKMKTTLEDPNVERLEAIREECGTDFGITVDPNQRFYSLHEAWRTLKEMDRVGNLHIVEDAFPRNALTETAELRRRMDALVVIHIDPPEMLTGVLRAEAAGGLNLDGWMGAYNWKMQAAAADQMNLPVWHGSGNDLGVATAMQLNLAASTPNCTLPGDQAGPWIREHHLLCEDFEVKEGRILVPPGPGLGVQVDRDAVDRYSIDHVEESA